MRDKIRELVPELYELNRNLFDEPAVDLPGLRLYELKGDMKGHYAVSVSGSWRVTFRFEDGTAVDVDYVDHH